MNQRKIQQIPMDGPPVKVKFLNLYEMERGQKVLNIGSCSLHAVCGSLKTADQAVWKVGQFLSCFMTLLRGELVSWNRMILIPPSFL